MADISITAASVLKTANTSIREGLAGATVTAGQPVYKDSNDDNALKPAIATSAAAGQAVGVALHGAADGQPLRYATAGNVTYNAVLAAGQVYCVSAAAAGGIAPVADMTTGNFVSILGVATSTTNLKLNITHSGVAKT